MHLTCLLVFAWLGVDDGITRLRGPTDAIQSIRFLPDDDRLVTAGLGNNASLWDVSTGALLGEFEGYAIDTAVTPTGKVVVACGGAKVRFYDVSNKQQENTWSIASADLQRSNRLPLSPDGRFVAVDSESNGLELWNTKDRAVQWTLSTPNGSNPWVLAFSGDGKRVAGVRSDGRIVIWDTSSGERIGGLAYDRVIPWSRRPPHREQDWAYSVDLTPDGQTLVIGWFSGGVSVWNVATNEFRALDFVLGGPVLSVAAHPKLKWIATGDGQGNVTVWDAKTSDELAAYSMGAHHKMLGLDVSHSGKLLAMSGYDSRKRLFRRKGSALVWDLSRLSE